MAPPLIQWNATNLMPLTGTSPTLDNMLRSVDALVSSHSLYWGVVTRDVTGSDYHALVLAPISSSATPGQRVVLTGDFTGSTSDFFQIRTIGTPETNTANTLYMGFTPNIDENGGGSYNIGGWNSDIPFGSNVRWSKYWPVGARAGATWVQCVESAETLMFVFRGPSNYVIAGSAGAIVSGYDSGSSENGRVYGMVTSGGGITALFWSSSTTFFGNSTTSTINHAGVFVVSGGVAHRQWDLIEKVTTLQVNASLPGPMKSSNMSIVGIPIALASTINARAVGYYRQMYMFNDTIATPVQYVLSGSSVNDAQVVGIMLSLGNDTVTADTVLFISTGSSI